MSWEKVPLADVADFINGFAFKPSDWHEVGNKIIRIQNLTDASKPFNLSEKIIPEKYHVSRGDILVSWSATLGVFEWEFDEKALVNQHIFKVNPHQNIKKDYLKHMLNDALEVMKKHLHGATMKHVNRKEFLATKIPLPPLAEQKRIADILDAADALRTKRRQAIAMLDEFLQASFLEMFGDYMSLPPLFPIEKLENIVQRITDGTHQSPQWSEAGVPFIFVSNIKNRNINFETKKFIDDKEYENLTKRCPIEVDDILYTTVGSYGNTARVRKHHGRFAFQRHIAHIKPQTEKVNSVYLEILLNSPMVKYQADKLVRGVAQKTLNLKELKEVKILLPPLELQTQFAKLVEQVETQKAQQKAHLAELDMLFGCLQQRAFSGELFPEHT